MGDCACVVKDTGYLYVHMSILHCRIYCLLGQLVTSMSFATHMTDEGEFLLVRQLGYLLNALQTCIERGY